MAHRGKGLSRAIVKRIVLPAAYRLGVLNLLVRRSRRDFVIVMYHGVHVAGGGFDFNPRHIPLADFERHLGFFQKNFDVISLPELCGILRRGERPVRKSLVITFDDGYRNNLRAFEAASARGIPVTVFIGTSVVVDQTAMHYADRLDFIVHTTRSNEVVFRGYRYVLADTRSRRAAARAIYEEMKREGTEGKTAILSSLEDTLKPDYGELARWSEFFSYVDENDLKLLAGNPLVEVGSHCVDHNNLEHLSPQEMEYQLAQSRRSLEDVLGRTVRVMSYPDGSYNAETIRIASRYYEAGCAVVPRIDRSGRNLYELGRFGLSADDGFFVHLFHLVRYLWEKEVPSAY